ncbi:hypothetical protein Ancab_026000, partial [Ancistrocladus abbreviatus]
HTVTNGTTVMVLSPRLPLLTRGSLLNLCKGLKDLKPFKSLIIVSGLIDNETIIGEFIRGCFDLGAPELAVSTFQAFGNLHSLLLQNLVIRRLCNCGFYEDVLAVYRRCRLVDCPSDDY